MTGNSLSDLEQTDDFQQRHIGPDGDDQHDMLVALGVSSLAELIDQVVPANIRLDEPLALGAPMSEPQTLMALRDIAKRNEVYRSWIGLGYSNCHTPQVIARNVLENPGWYTAYTPYQPEISQGRLEALLNFQTMVCDLTGLPLANASLLDEATAAAEAMTLCQRCSKSKDDEFFVVDDCHPQTLAVIQTRADPLGIRVTGGSLAQALDAKGFGVLIQYPGSSGELSDYAELVERVHARGGLVVVACDLLALTLLKPPGEFGADVAVGNSQRFGVPLGNGGPHAAFFATRDEFKRSLPGRLVGVSVDTTGRPAYRLALQTREQHIRREKATSNICTAQALLAIMASMYGVYHGPQGLRTIAQRVFRSTALLKAGLQRLGFSVANEFYFDTLTVVTGEHTAAVHTECVRRRINLRRSGTDRIGISLDETTERGDLEQLFDVFVAVTGTPRAFTIEQLDSQLDAVSAPEGMIRSSEFLTHPIFNRYHSETEMMRYLRALMDKDLALDRAMIPLGSCTMKLNAVTEMVPIGWPEFAAVHPFAPANQTDGYRQLVEELEHMLCACTGYDAVSLQPNSGAQGEYAGLLVIRAYQAYRGEAQRDICLIPSSAHGTNPASAQLAGLRVVVVGCDSDGNIDWEDLVAKAEQHSARLAALMVTYPSTHGVFETQIRQICDLIHEHGGQVYLDGANLNAQVGLCAPGKYGADVSHLNLHKTFCIPHGGGGPGVGPIGVRSHLADFLPGHPLAERSRPHAIGPVAATPFGSAGILPISWAYITLMGGAGLRNASEVAILSANYIATRLADHFPVLYTGQSGRVAHECIIDLRPLKDTSGVTVDDVAKRLIDYGFHAPTMSWPVAGTLMIEPTESESKFELDRFCEALIAIRAEIAKIERGEFDPQDNPLRNAPHTAEQLIADDWSHPYSRSLAGYPVSGLRERKYWSPVGRIDNVYGDRNLVCSCPPLSDYQDL